MRALSINMGPAEGLLDKYPYEEGLFEEAVVTGLDDRLLSCVVLRSIGLALNGVEEFSTARGIYDVTESSMATVDGYESTLDRRQSENQRAEDLRYHNKTVVLDALGDEPRQLVRLGSIIHLHHMMVTETDTPTLTEQSYVVSYCVKPDPLDGAGVEDVIDNAYGAAHTLLQQKIEGLELQEANLITELKTVRRGDIFPLFEGAEVKLTDRGDEYISVPDRVLVGGYGSPQIIRVRGRPYYARDAEDAGLIFFTLSHAEDAHQYRMNDLFPLEEVGNNGLPANFSVPRVRLEVTIINPVRITTRAVAEQRLVVRLGQESFGAVVNEDRLVGDQGFGGVVYDTFRLSGEAVPNYTIMSPNGQPLRHVPLGNQIVLPADPEFLESLQAEFLGI